MSVDQRYLPWFSQLKGLGALGTQPEALALELPKMPLAQRCQLLSGLCNMVTHYVQEVESSACVQQELLPERPPTLPGVEIAVRYLPMLGVSGDYYDLLPLSESRIGLAIGDVCGKGMGAALLMASVCATLRQQVRSDPTGVGELLTHLNQVMYRDAPEHRFVTLTYGIYNVGANTFTYSKCGTSTCVALPSCKRACARTERR